MRLADGSATPPSGGDIPAGANVMDAEVQAVMFEWVRDTMRFVMGVRGIVTPDEFHERSQRVLVELRQANGGGPAVRADQLVRLVIDWAHEYMHQDDAGADQGGEA